MPTFEASHKHPGWYQAQHLFIYVSLDRKVNFFLNAGSAEIGDALVKQEELTREFGEELFSKYQSALSVNHKEIMKSDMYNFRVLHSHNDFNTGIRCYPMTTSAWSPFSDSLLNELYSLVVPVSKDIYSDPGLVLEILD